ncbi:MAG: hypothetical protein AB7G93_03120 [Bdellovibrionales bacterium]
MNRDGQVDFNSHGERISNQSSDLLIAHIKDYGTHGKSELSSAFTFGTNLCQYAFREPADFVFRCGLRSGVKGLSATLIFRDTGHESPAICKHLKEQIPRLQVFSGREWRRRED